MNKEVLKNKEQSLVTKLVVTKCYNFPQYIFTEDEF